MNELPNVDGPEKVRGNDSDSVDGGTSVNSRLQNAVFVIFACLCIFGCFVYAAVYYATNRSTEFEERIAPSFEITQWAQLPEGKEFLDVDDFRGKVLYIYCFQSQCHGCREHGFPILQELNKNYKDDPDVAFVAIQTTFGGWEHNTFENAQKEMERFELPEIPVGHSAVTGERSPVMINFGTGATPWVVMLDRRGIVAYNHYPMPVEKAVEIIEQLKES